MALLTGGCHCGALRYQLDAPLDDCAHCHCSDCRKTSGGIVTTWLTVPAHSFTWLTGAPACYQSSPSCTRHFCAQCGCLISLATGKAPEALDVTVASLDEPEQAPAHRHVWASSHLNWLYLDPQLPAEAQENGVN
ncbi:GFA family protein [Atopomonas sediminilitoris]|uniref:GFA family protein n=1 Tax=Atopomonas sediminilitoris TaxID=2919919 RepID=UPI001F4DE75D|nr:GFA family protein [Atopomonas sediminilitoris]MCJ8170488.1 GFA family protein [Atopomonas sediminilitoris]